MQNTSGDILEFEALRALVGRYVRSPLGEAKLEETQPSSDPAELERIHGETAEAIEYSRAAAQPQPSGRSTGRLRFDGLPDATRATQLLRIEGSSLDARQIYEVIELLDRAGDARAQLAGVEGRHPRLAKIVAALADFRPALREVSGKILPDGSLSDDASVALKRVRRDMEKQQKLIQASLERFLRAHRDDGTLQEEYVTIRNERFVVPVVAGARRKVDGVIHGASGSGQTLFVEPLETIDLNNELVRLKDEEIEEINRILRDLTDRLRKHSGDITAAVDVMGRLDLLFGKAAYAADFDCVVPRFSPEENRRLALKAARHPLLQDILRRQRKPIVPVSLTLEKGTRTLLISGPNTGGKTVAMKTAGLLTLAAHAGFPVPAEDAEFPIFDQVLADVGDNQSIEQSLSSFSAHIATVKEMLESATRDSLLLLDELGRATDPEEGGALGVAILDSFRTSGAFTLASTHLLALKIYGANTAGVLNASMGFDEDTLQPTYVLRTGTPGKSAGLDIASRLGLSPSLIERARGVMSSNERDIARFLSELHQRLETTAQLEEALREKERQLAAREAALEKEWERKGQAKIRDLERKTAELVEKFEAQSRQTIEEISHSMEQRKAAEQAQRRVSKTKREFQELVAAEIQPVTSGSKPQAARPAILEGTRVRLRGIRQPARVRRLLGDGRIEVDAGLMKMQVTLDDVEEVLDAGGNATALPQGVSFTQGPRWDTTYSEINVIGKRAEEAVENIDKFVDSAALADVQRIRIVHGHGMGILRKAVHDLLSKNPHVAKFYAATPSEGGTGATIVELKAD